MAVPIPASRARPAGAPPRPWSSTPVSSRRSTVQMAPPPTSPLMPDEPTRPTGSPNPNATGNFIRNLEAPKFGVDRFIESRLAAGAGTRELRGGSSKGFVYRAGPYRGMTEGQAREKARAEYAALGDGERQRYEAGAEGRDVMSGREVAREGQHYAARGIAAGGGSGTASASPGSPTASPSPAPAPMRPGNNAVMSRPGDLAPRNTPGEIVSAATPTRAERAPGTINGTPVDLIRAQGEARRAAGAGVSSPASPAPAPAAKPTWQDEFRERFGREPGSPEQQEEQRQGLQKMYDRAAPEPTTPPAGPQPREILPPTNVQPENLAGGGGLVSGSPSPLPPTTAPRPTSQAYKIRKMGSTAEFKGEGTAPAPPAPIPMANTVAELGISPDYVRSVQSTARSVVDAHVAGARRVGQAAEIVGQAATTARKAVVMAPYRAAKATTEAGLDLAKNTFTTGREAGEKLRRVGTAISRDLR